MSITHPTSSAASVLTDGDTELVQELEEAATDRWGDEWAISIRRWSDGSAQIYAEHLVGLTEDGHREKERLWPDGDGGFLHDAVTVERPATVSHDVIEEQVRSE
ncbi:hypothetical protein [Natronosalvus rutilus]|uniref:Uncharacterized protein n=1 Tax=Natronosalvus rutilus TaxID=2953753 RepID=A0A9E7NFR1_9EURY|nr:hypothetical protein [Natronosalvus rutilus]UTF55957.1 hypothetical protein NGM29_20920 [Natronosalvus rutilus]